MATRPMTAAEWGMLIALSILWGGSFLFNGILVRELPPFTIVMARVALAALALWTIVRISGHAVPRSRLAGVLVGFLGVALMIGPSVLSDLGTNVLAQLAVLGGAVSYAIAGIFGRRFRRMGLPPLLPAAGQVTASAVLLLPVALVVDRPWTLAMPSAEAWAALFGLAFLATALAYVIFFRILATAGATNLMLVTFLIPVSAILLGALVLGEVLAPKHFAGMALIAVGLAAIDGRLLRMFMEMRRPLGSDAGG